MKCFFCLVALTMITCPFMGYSQRHKVIAGRVLCEIDNTPVEYAVIRIDKDIFVADSMGNFQFSIPSSLKSVKCIVSGVGYADSTLVLRKITTNKRFDIKLNFLTYHIPKITVFATLNKPTLIIGDTTLNENKNNLYRLKERGEVGIIVKNNRKILLNAVYVNIDNYLRVGAPFVVRIKTAKSMRANRVYHNKDFLDITEPFICRADKVGMLKIDLQQHGAQLKSDIIITISPLPSQLGFEYDIEEPIVSVLSTGKVIRQGVTNNRYYGPTIGSYSNCPEGMHVFLGINGQYSYSDVSGMKISPPQIAVAYKILKR